MYIVTDVRGGTVGIWEGLSLIFSNHGSQLCQSPEFQNTIRVWNRKTFISYVLHACKLMVDKLACV